MAALVGNPGNRELANKSWDGLIRCSSNKKLINFLLDTLFVISGHDAEQMTALCRGWFFSGLRNVNEYVFKNLTLTIEVCLSLCRPSRPSENL